MITSVIIPTKDRKTDLLKPVQSIDQQAIRPDELIIIDASENQDVNDQLLRNRLNIMYLHSDSGAQKQRNLGIKRASGDILFFFDDDVIIEPDYIKCVTKVFEDDKKNEIGAVMGKIIMPDVSGEGIRLIFNRFERFIGKIINTTFLLSDLSGTKFKLSGFPRFAHLLKQSQQIECLSGCCMAFRKGVFNNMKFDENLISYSYMDDSDISKGVLDQGYVIFYEPTARLVHNQSPIGRLKTFKIAKMRVVNHYYLFKKNWPQTYSRKIAFWWSICGLFLLSIYTPQLEGVRGTVSGVIDVLTAKSDLVKKGRKLKYYPLIPARK